MSYVDRVSIFGRADGGGADVGGAYGRGTSFAVAAQGAYRPFRGMSVGRGVLAAGLAIWITAGAGGKASAEDSAGDVAFGRLLTAAQFDSPLPPDATRIGDGESRSIFGDPATRIPSVKQGRFELPPLMAVTTDTSQIGNGRLPDGFRADDPTPLRPLPESASERGFQESWAVRDWAAPNTFSNPRYFEDRMLERHGHDRWGHFQPLASGARFFGTLPMLPYLMTVKSPWDAEYTLGHFRAGSRTPGFLQRPPWERRAAIAEGVAIAGGVIAFP